MNDTDFGVALPLRTSSPPKFVYSKRPPPLKLSLQVFIWEIVSVKRAGAVDLRP